MRARLALSLTLVIGVLGCNAPTSTLRHGPSKSTAGANRAPAAVTSTADPIVVGAGDRPRVVDQTLGVATQLIGKVKLVSDKGLGLIANNGGGLVSDKGLGLIGNNAAGIISNHSGGLISDKALGLVANNGGGLVANNGGGLGAPAGLAGHFGLLADAPASQAPLEFLLADATIALYDARGQLLVDEHQQPLTASTDHTGNYQFKGVLPPGNLIMKIQIANRDLLSGGELSAMVTRSSAAAQGTLDIDTASSLGASYVLGRYVKQNQAIYDRLPDSEAQTLHANMASARALLASKDVSYQPDALVAAAEHLRQATPVLDQTLQRIEALLLAGQKNLGNGLAAVDVALSQPTAIIAAPDGAILIGEGVSTHIRRVASDGTVGELLPQRQKDGSQPEPFADVVDMVYGPDGALYIAEASNNRVRKIAPDGQVSLVAGTGVIGQGPVDVPANQTMIKSPAALAFGPDGTLYIGEATRLNMYSTLGNRLLSVDPQGILHQVPTPEPDWAHGMVTGLAVAADGTLYAYQAHDGGHGAFIARKKPAGAWDIFVPQIESGPICRLLLAPNGTLYASSPGANRVYAVAADGHLTPVAGNGVAGESGDGGPATRAQLNGPTGLFQAADGTMFITEPITGTVRIVAPDGTIRTFAGSTGLQQQGDAMRIAVSGPTGLAIDPQGRLVVTEGKSSTVKRLENGQLTAIAGTLSAQSVIDVGDGGPAIAAKLAGPAGAVYVGPDLYILDAGSYRLRKVTPDGLITTVAGSADRGPSRTVLPGDNTWPALGPVMRRPTAMAVGPDRTIYWADNENNQIMRLRADGRVELVAGSVASKSGYAGDGGPATQALLNLPMGLAFDSKGNLYVTDFGNLVIRKIDRAGQITTFAGLPSTQALLKLAGGFDPSSQKAVDATSAVLVGPTGMRFDANDTLYVGEVGTANLSAFGIAGSVGSLAALPAYLPKTPAHIYRIGSDGKLSVVAGSGSALLSDASGDNSLGFPIGLVIDPQGRLVIADETNNQIRALPKGSY